LSGTGYVGVTTSKGLGCRARRNRAKRRAKEAWVRAGLSPDWDVVLSVKSNADRASFADLAADVLRAAQEARQAWNRS
jgi:ribonuclease P protein component